MCEQLWAEPIVPAPTLYQQQQQQQQQSQYSQITKRCDNRELPAKQVHRESLTTEWRVEDLKQSQNHNNYISGQAITALWLAALSAIWDQVGRIGARLLPAFSLETLAPLVHRQQGVKRSSSSTISTLHFRPLSLIPHTNIPRNTRALLRR